ncbi:class I SAM-dependent methyltransferase, partial [candidate division KSB1 bacterium]|nr:class I SAM-dependent methyltransferase [candidate division KSB1 bacterium]
MNKFGGKFWNERYSSIEFVYGTEPNIFFKDELDKLKTGNILLLGEGEGRNAVFLAMQGYSVTAVDQSAVGLEKAESLAIQYGVEITTEVVDLADYDLGCEVWDGIVSIAAHVLPLLRKELHAQVVKSLKDDGVFILEAYTEHQIEMSGFGGPPPSQ